MGSFSIFVLFGVFFMFPTGSQARLESAEMVKKALAKPSTVEPLLDETVSFRPIKNHHFNLEAPQDCGKEASLDPSAREISCQFHTPGSREVVVSVCDDPKKYCKQETFTVVVQDKKSGQTRMVVPPAAETRKMQAELKKKVMAGFQVLSPEAAEKAAAGKKGVLVVFSADWCPPCNMAKEFLFSHPNFAKVMGDLLLVYVDGDSPESIPWKPVLNAYYYPSFVLLNTKLEVLDLNTGYMSLAALDRWTVEGLKARQTFKDLETSVQRRLKGALTQKFWDLFKSQGEIQSDAEKLTHIYFRRAEKENALKLIDDAHIETLRGMALENKYMDVAFKKERSRDEQTSYEGMAVELLQGISKNPDAGALVVSTYCADEKLAAKSELCETAVDEAISASENKAKKDWDLLSEGEKALAMANLAKQIVRLRDVKNLKAPATKSAAKACLLAHEGLKKYSPLKDKSRVARIGQMGCGSEASSTSGKIPVLESLIQDFPFEETFYRKLADVYQKEKKFKKALEYNDSALKYSYGVMWLHNVLSRAEILNAMNNPKKAFAFLKENMQEVQIEDGRYAWVFEKMRTQYEELKKAAAL